MTDAWYPPAGSYWVDPEIADQYPLRYGDVVVAPEGCTDSKGKPWHAAMVLSPSCVLVSKAKPETSVLVARVRPVTAMSAGQRPAVRVGWQERDGQIYVAHAATFWMPPVPGADDDSFVRFDDVQSVRYDQLDRHAALAHEARVFLIRREIYYRYRWIVPVEQVRALEAGRISLDPNFEGPRPPWGQEP